MKRLRGWHAACAGPVVPFGCLLFGSDVPHWRQRDPMRQYDTKSRAWNVHHNAKAPDCTAYVSDTRTQLVNRNARIVNCAIALRSPDEPDSVFTTLSDDSSTYLDPSFNPVYQGGVLGNRFFAYPCHLPKSR